MNLFILRTANVDHKMKIYDIMNTRETNVGHKTKNILNTEQKGEGNVKRVLD